MIEITDEKKDEKFKTVTRSIVLLDRLLPTFRVYRHLLLDLKIDK